MQGGTYNVYLCPPTHLKGLGKDDKQSKKGVESAGKDRGNWRVKGAGIEEEEKRKWKLPVEYEG